MSWTTSTSFALPTRTATAPATEANKLKFSMIRAMYDQTATTGVSLSLKSYYRSTDTTGIVNSTTYKNMETDINSVDVDISYGNTVTSVSASTDDGISMKSFRGAFKEYEIVVEKFKGWDITHTVGQNVNVRKKIIRHRFTDTIYHVDTDNFTDKGKPGIQLNCLATNIKIILHVPASVTVYGGPGRGGTAGTPGTGGSAGGSAGTGATDHSYNAVAGTDAIAGGSAGDPATVGGPGGDGGDCLTVLAMNNDLILYNLGTLKPGGGGGGGSGGGGGGGSGGNGGGGGIGANGTIAIKNQPAPVYNKTTVSGVNFNTAPNMGNFYWEAGITGNLYYVRIYWFGAEVHYSTHASAPPLEFDIGVDFPPSTSARTCLRGQYRTGSGAISPSTPGTNYYRVDVYTIGDIPYPSADGGNGGLGASGLSGSSIAGIKGSYYNGWTEQDQTDNLAAVATGADTVGVVGDSSVFTYSSQIYEFYGGARVMNNVASQYGDRRHIAGTSGSGGSGGTGGGGGGYAVGGGGGTFGGGGTTGGDGIAGGIGTDGIAGGNGSAYTTATKANGGIATYPNGIPFSYSYLFQPLMVGATNGGARTTSNLGGSSSSGGAGGAGGAKRGGVTPTGTVTSIGGW